MSKRGNEQVRAVTAAVRWGVAGAVVTMLCLGILAVLAVPPFLPADESSHAGYALEVADGNLPDLEDRVTPEMPGQRELRYYLANHPPLYHAMVGPILEWAVDHDHPIAGVRVVRAFTVVLAAGTVAMTAALAHQVVRRRRAEVTVLAAGLAATVPTFVTTAAAVHNDLVAVLSAVVAAYGATAALVQGPRRWHVVLVCVGSAATMATRLNGLPIVAVAAAALGLATLLHDADAPARRVLRAGLRGAAPVAAVLAASGWFYWRNYRLYGDISGVTHNRSLGDRRDVYTPFSWLTDRQTLPDLLTRVEGGGPWRHIQFFGAYDRKVLAVVVAVVAVGAVVVARRAIVDLLAWRRGRAGTAVAAGAEALETSGDPDGQGADADARVEAGAGEEDRARWAAGLGRGLAIAMLAGLPLMLWVLLSVYVSQTGTPNPRYLFPALPVVAIAVAVCCLNWWRWVGVLLGVALLVAQVLIGVMSLGRWINLRTGSAPTGPFDQLRDSLEAGDVPAPGAVLALLVGGALVGVAVQAVAMWKLGAAPEPRAEGDEVIDVSTPVDPLSADDAASIPLAASGSAS